MALTRVREYQVDTKTVGVDDPVTTLNELQTGPNDSDIGFVMNRGTSGNVGFIWNEINNLFRLIYTSDSGKELSANVAHGGSGNVTITNNAPIMTGTQFISTGNFTLEGDARAGVYIQRNETTGLAITQLFSNGIDENLVVSPNSVWTYDIMISAKRIDAGMDAASFNIVGSAARNDTLDSVFLVGSPSITVIGRTDSVWNAAVEVNTVSGALVIKVQGSLGKTVRWVAKIMTLEVAYN